MRGARPHPLFPREFPICLCAVVVLLNVAGRSLNVVSLAGLAFATGMVLDAAMFAFEKHSPVA